MDLPLGWLTDLAVLRAAHAEIDERADHVVVRTPSNPSYYWGNFVLALDAADDAEHWLAVFEEAHPDAVHRSIGLVAEPVDPEGWAAFGFALEHDDVLSADRMPTERPLPAGYRVRELRTDADWAASTALRAAHYPGQADFERDSTAMRRAMVEEGSTAWFAAYAPDGTVAAELGIVDVGNGVARYQSVLTAAEHRRRGLTGHLLGVAARWAADRGCPRLVIVADDGSDADRLYRSVGFRPSQPGWRVLRAPIVAG
ncbi:GNAT family N-acetyltransferase [Marmoricola sp. RAF53]|uniref:GNAT family N-acetyltransferase n=1 Tax=Marmoricola sp. RAF53 TaxID=3233059 RepID=UPI003F9817BE